VCACVCACVCECVCVSECVSACVCAHVCAELPSPLLLALTLASSTYSDAALCIFLPLFTFLDDRILTSQILKLPFFTKLYEPWNTFCNFLCVYSLRAITEAGLEGRAA